MTVGVLHLSCPIRPHMGTLCGKASLNPTNTDSLPICLDCKRISKHAGGECPICKEVNDD